MLNTLYSDSSLDFFAYYQIMMHVVQCESGVLSPRLTSGGIDSF